MVLRLKRSVVQHGCIAVVLLFGGAGGCRDGSGEQPMVANSESLRLTPEQIAQCESDVARGDAAAAKKLWHYYDFIADDYPTAEAWREMYERLSGVATKTE